MNAVDNFATPVISQPDTAGILPALGLGTFFTGSSASDIQVSPSLVSNPSLVAGGLTADPGDSSNLTRLAALQNQPTLAGGTQTFDQAYASLVGGIGTEVSQLTDQQTTQQALSQQLQRSSKASRESIPTQS